jgi:peptide/histidine transporter 3/4
LYIQDNVGWGLGFGIVVVTMEIQLFIFLCGTRLVPIGIPLTRIIHVFVAKFYKWNVSTSHQEKRNVDFVAERELLKFGSRREYFPTDQFR